MEQIKRLSAYSCVYYRKTDEGIIITCVYVDDFIIAGCSRELCDAFKAQIRGLRNISDLGDASFCLGLAISCSRTDRTISLLQTALMDRIVTTFGQAAALPISTPMDSNLHLRRQPPNSPSCRAEAALPYRSLKLASSCTLQLAHVLTSLTAPKLTQFLDCHRQACWDAAIHVVCYLKGTRTLSLVLGGDPDINLVGFSGSSYVDCLDT